MAKYLSYNEKCNIYTVCLHFEKQIGKLLSLMEWLTLLLHLDQQTKKQLLLFLLTVLFSGSSAFFAFFIVTWTLYFFSIHCWICLVFVSKSCCPIFEEKISSLVRVGPSLKQWDLVLGLLTTLFIKLTSPLQKIYFRKS